MKNRRPTNHDVCVVGLGVIGLPLALLFARAGHRVLGVDNNKDLIASLAMGEPSSCEPRVKSLLRCALRKKSFKVSTSSEPSTYYIICANALSAKRSSSSAYKFLLAVCRQHIARFLPHSLVLVETTSPVGTTERLKQDLEKLLGFKKVPVDIAYVPERCSPGNIIEEIRGFERLVGATTLKSGKLASKLYSSITDAKMHIVDSRSAELSKLLENSYRGVSIAFANECGDVCDRFKMDAGSVLALANTHPRVRILSPGIGVGGHCVPFDPGFLNSKRARSSLISASRYSHGIRERRVFLKICKLIDHLEPRRIAILGLTYKADTGSFTNSPAARLYLNLRKVYAGRVCGYDPFQTEKSFPFNIGKEGVEMTLANATQGAGLIVILVAHSIFKPIYRSNSSNVFTASFAGLL